MRFLVAIASFAVIAAASKYEQLFLQEWKTYKLTHRLTFGNATEEHYRLTVFLDNRIKNAKHNAMFAEGKVLFKIGTNRFSHLLECEVVDMMNGYNRTARRGGLLKPKPKPMSTFAPKAVEVPDAMDWRDKGAVTDIKDQGECGACYAFSATGALEGQHFLKMGTLVAMSEQNIVDCSYPEGNVGCDGGVPDYAFQYIKNNKGVDTEDSYPYTGQDNGTCSYISDSVAAMDTGYADLPSGDEEALKEAVATIGPISVAIDAGQPSFTSYVEGVYYEQTCGNTDEYLDHAVLVVGYGSTAGGVDYWIVKNSWGTDWGEKGYIRMARNQGNNCGIATAATYPIV